MKAKEIKGLSVEDLKDKVEELTAKQEKMKLADTVTKLENPLQLRSNRRDIARVKTELRSRETKKA
jgi:large subunit ribosomal protein L29